MKIVQTRNRYSYSWCRPPLPHPSAKPFAGYCSAAVSELNSLCCARRSVDTTEIQIMVSTDLLALWTKISAQHSVSVIERLNFESFLALLEEPVYFYGMDRPAPQKRIWFRADHRCIFNTKCPYYEPPKWNSSLLNIFYFVALGQLTCFSNMYSWHSRNDFDCCQSFCLDLVDFVSAITFNFSVAK